MKNAMLLTLLLIVACGKTEERSSRCYSRAEAINYCAAHEMADSGVTLDVAKQLCAPHYPYESCYSLTERGN